MATKGPLYYSPADFAMHENNFLIIPMPKGNNHMPPSCPSPDGKATAGSGNSPLLFSQSDAIEFSPEIKRRREHGGTWRIMFTIAVFCIGSLIVYFTLANIYGTEVVPDDSAIPPLRKSGQDKIYQRFPRSDELIDMSAILEEFKQREYKFKIIAFAWKRFASLTRLLDSLKAAEYFGYPVDLEIHLDAGASEEIISFLKNDFIWPFGASGMILQSRRLGLAGMVTSAWKPPSDTEFAFFFEDDIEASKFYFEFACRAIFAYSDNERLIGVALSTPRYDEINLLTSIWLPEWEIGRDWRVFLFQLPCSWGVLYFPWAWRSFLTYYKNASGFPVIPVTRINIWQRSWKRFLAELMFIEGQVMLYASLPNQTSFAVNHREIGEHTDGTAQDPQLMKLNDHEIDYYTTPIVTEHPDEAFFQLQSQEFSKLPLVSLHHDLVHSFAELEYRKRLSKQ